MAWKWNNGWTTPDPESPLSILRNGTSPRARAFLILLALLAAAPLTAQSRPAILLDRDWSIHAGVRNLSTAEGLLFKFQDRLLPPRFTDERTVFTKSLGIGYRLLRLAAIDQPEIGMSMVTLHEVFGHGARAREFDWPSSFELDAPFPYGAGGGLTRTELPDAPEPSRLMALFVGGMEADNLTARMLTNRWASRGSVTYWEGQRYFYAFFDQWLYIASDDNGEGDDVSHYLGRLNQRRTLDGNRTLSREDLRSQMRPALLNPQLYLSLYGMLGAHLIGGHDTLGFPMFGLGHGYRYLPYARYSLAPHGPELHLEQLLKTGDRSYALDLRHAAESGQHSWGVGAEGTRLLHTGSWEFDAKIGFWGQPSLTGVDPIASEQLRFGGMTTVTGRWQPAQGAIGLVAELGYKSSGFAEGERLGKGLILRIGMGMK